MAVSFDLLRDMNRNRLDWHASRYNSAHQLRRLVVRVQEDGNISSNAIGQEVREIAQKCVDDGADYGFIPCLGGYERDAWTRLLTRHRARTDYLATNPAS